MAISVILLHSPCYKAKGRVFIYIFIIVFINEVLKILSYILRFRAESTISAKTL